MNIQEPIVSIRGLCKDFERPNGSIQSVLEGIDIDVYQDELISIVGLSGSGKSTLLRCMAGLIPADRGKITYHEMYKENLQLGAFVFQNFALFPWMTIKDNIAVSMRKLEKDEIEKRTDQIIDTIGLKGFEDCYPRELSGGMRQRVSLARALVSDPMILYMDEPFSALDPLTGESLRAEILRIWLMPNKKIHAGILVTHKFEEALQLADRIVILSSNPGKIYKIIEIRIPRPRNPLSEEYKKAQEVLEKTFSELHFSKEQHKIYVPTEIIEAKLTPISNEKTKQKTSDQSLITKPIDTSFKSDETSIKPLININIPRIDGLLNRLSISHLGSADIYDLGENMNINVNELVSAVKATEGLGFIKSTGNSISLSENGWKYVKELALTERIESLQQAMLRFPIMQKVCELLLDSNDDGVEKKTILEEITRLTPFEDSDLQFDTLVRWGRYANLLTYDINRERFYKAESIDSNSKS